MSPHIAVFSKTLVSKKEKQKKRNLILTFLKDMECKPKKDIRKVLDVKYA